ncbi:hypothetical protein D3C72_2406630 [compost metagenome]
MRPTTSVIAPAAWRVSAASTMIGPRLIWAREATSPMFSACKAPASTCLSRIFAACRSFTQAAKTATI